MNKVVISVSYGEFSLSQEALDALETRKGEPVPSEGRHLDRHDPDLIAVVEELGERANGDFAELVIVLISGNEYNIDVYDGSESVYTPKNFRWTVI